MKILGWMHRKLMHNTNTMDQIKNPTIAATALSLHSPFHDQNYFIRPASRLSNSNSSTYSDSTAMFEEEGEESFDFLSIGTFGVELLNTEPATPALPMSVEEDQPVEITESDLDLINQELEKFLDAEETELASQRSSHASIITLSYKGGGESEGHVHMAPLQNYLLAASVEMVETEKEGKRERASLGELFKRSNVIQEDEEVKKCEEHHHHQSRKGNVAHFMKKVVKKFNSSSNAAAADTPPTKNKLSKTIVKMFNKKVYPEEMTEKQFMKLAKSRNRSISHEDTHTAGSETKKTKKKTIKLSFAGICRGASPVNAAGHWIKTDSDYLVLEL